MSNRPEKFTYASTGTGASTGYADFPTGVSQAHASFNNVTTSTKQKVKLQASIGGSGDWFDISGVTTLSTTITTVASTATFVVDRVRFNVTGGTTNTGTQSVIS